MTPTSSARARTQAEVQLILSRCKEVIVRQLGALLKDFFREADQRLFLHARDAKSNVEQRDFFDATLALKNERQRLESEISHVLLVPMDRVGEPAKAGAEARANEQSGEFSLLDPGELEKLITLAKCISKAETLYKIPLHQLGQRLTCLLAVRIDQSDLPVGPAAVCDAFSSVLASLKLNWPQMKEIYEALENAVIPHLGRLYTSLHELLIEQGILPVLEQGRPLLQPGLPAHRSQRGNETAPAETPAPDPLDLRPDHTRGRFRQDSYSENTKHSVYHTAQTLWALQRHIKSAVFNETAGSLRPLDTLGAPLVHSVAETTWPFYNPAELTNALARLAPELETMAYEAANINLKERLLSVLARQQGGRSEKRLGEPESMAIDMVAELLGSMDEDPLLGNTIKSQIRRLQFPICAVALSDPDFLSTESHPLRQVLNQLARLQTFFSGQGNTQALEQPAIDHLIERITHRFSRDPGVFTEVLEELNQWVEAGNREYSENVAQVIRGCEQQQAFLKARRKDPEDLPDPNRVAPLLAEGLPEAVRTEWMIWLERAKRLKVGDTITFNKGSGTSQRLGLAWMGENHHPYVFVDAQGRKASTMSLQELAVQLRSGAISLLEQAELSAVDRALQSVLYKLHGQLRQQSLHDPLTGLENRKRFMERLEQAALRARQEHTQNLLGCLRLDRFELLADKYGPDAMNALLKRLAEWLTKHIGDKGYLARVNDNEFALLFEQCSLEQGRELAKRQVETLAKVQVRYKQELLTISASMGLVEVTGEIDSAEALLKMAISACLAASAAGGNCVHAYKTPELEPLLQEKRIDWQAWLDRVLEGEELALYCQRITPLKQDHAPLSHYAILPGASNRDPANVLPEDPVPEFASKIQALDRQIIQTVLRWMAAQREQPDRLGTYIIKLSRYALQDEQLLEYVIEQLIDSKAPPGKICFELQEAAVIANLSQAQRLVRTLKEFGCWFSLSGFGTAATQDYLTQLSIDYLTIDGVFVKEIARDPTDYAMVKSTNEIGHLLGKKTIAQDVETEALLERLREIGVDYAKGPAIEPPWLMEEGGSND